MVYRIGDRITSRDVTNYTEYTGTVAEVIYPVRFSGDSGPRYRLVDTGYYYINGKPVEPIVYG